MSYTERDLIELACRAPAVPEWFQPDIRWENPPGADWTGIHPLMKTTRLYQEARISQWPKAYARRALEAK